MHKLTILLFLKTFFEVSQTALTTTYPLPSLTYNLTNFANLLWVWNMTVGSEMQAMQMVIDTSLYVS